MAGELSIPLIIFFSPKNDASLYLLFTSFTSKIIAVMDCSIIGVMFVSSWNLKWKDRIIKGLVPSPGDLTF